jgi:hypothetical protein
MRQNEFLILMADRTHPVEAMLLHILAGLFLLWVLSLVWEGLVFKRLTHDPVIGKTLSAAAAWISLLLIGIETGFAVPGVMRDHDLPALLLLVGLALWSGFRMREQIRLEDEQA